jgi:hypothetical protein
MTPPTRRHYISFGRGALLLLAWSFAAQAQPAALTLACKGTAISSSNPKDVADPKSGEDPMTEPVSMGIIINFTTRAVQGFGYPGLVDYPVTIKGTNDVKIVFGGQQTSGLTNSIIGSLDRVTGELLATSSVIGPKGNTLTATTYTLQCKPTQRMF